MRTHQICATLAILVVATYTACADHHEVDSPSTPKIGHQTLLREVGTWDAETKTWIDPDAPPVISRGVEINQMLGEYWVVGVYESELFGKPFRGQSQVGYDPAKKKFIGTWIDSMSPALNRLEGTMKDNSLTMFATGVDPKTGEEKTTKMISTYPDAMHKTFAAFEPIAGKEDEWRKTMEVVYTKRAE
ncbi:MAG: DUF1579 domain-containing protein [Planctomycetota bacterium]